MRQFAITLVALSVFCSFGAFAQVAEIPPHSLSPTPASGIFPRGSGTLDSAAAALESSVLSLANSANKAVRGQGVCSSDSTCAGFLHFAKVCSEKESSASIAGCICSSASLEVMNACTSCISSNSVKINANHFSSFCNSASSTLAILAASQTATPTTTSLSTSSTQAANQDQHSGTAGQRLGFHSVEILLIIIAGLGITLLS